MPLATSLTWATFLDIVEVKAYLQWQPNTSVAQDPILQMLIEAACSWIQNELGRPVGATTITERHDGWGGEYIMLHYTPVLELVSVGEYMSTGGNNVLIESTPENPVDGVQFNFLTGRLMRTFTGYSWPRPFFPGSRNIEVTYVAGYNPVPAELKLATLELIKYLWINTMQAGAGNGLYDQPDNSNQLWAGIPYRVQAWIAPYKRVVIA